MIILLTGAPGVGKTTILQKFLELYKEPTLWIITRRLPNPSGDGGLGFEATDSLGRTQLISHKTDINSDIIVGRNHVDAAAVENMFMPILEKATTHTGELPVIDELGSIQLAAPSFAAFLAKIFTPQADLVAIIHAEDPRLEEYRQSPHAILLEATEANRDMLPQAILAMASQRQLFNALTPAQQKLAMKLLKNYVNQAQLVQIEKFMHHALKYVEEGRVNSIAPNKWQVHGDHGKYETDLKEGEYSCSCDLFQGRGKYAGHAGECSHIQAVQLLSLR